jgi:hypothetical protein
MKLSQKAIDEFKAIYLAEFGKEIGDDEALKMGWNLLCLYRLLLKTSGPVPQSEQVDVD